MPAESRTTAVSALHTYAAWQNSQTKRKTDHPNSTSAEEDGDLSRKRLCQGRQGSRSVYLCGETAPDDTNVPVSGPATANFTREPAGQTSN